MQTRVFLKHFVRACSFLSLSPVIYRFFGAERLVKCLDKKISVVKNKCMYHTAKCLKQKDIWKNDFLKFFCLCPLCPLIRNFSMIVWPEFRRGKEICPLIRAVHILQCPLIGDYTVACKRTLNYLAKWSSFRLRTKWLWVRVPLKSLKIC